MSAQQQPKTNRLAEFLNALINRAVKILTELALKVVAGHLPWLNFWPLNALFKHLLEKKSQEYAKYGKQRVTKAVIDKQIEKEVVGADAAKENLRESIEKGEADEIAKASAEFDRKYGDLIRGNGSINNVN